MNNDSDSKGIASVSFCSSLRDDVWHNLAGPNAFESWHFDAVADDGRSAVVISFYDNHVLSPRFYRNPKSPENITYSGNHRFPAVSFVYAIDGKPILHAVNEFVEGDFASTGTGCAIGGSEFRVEMAEYGFGFMVTIDVRTFGGRRIRADLEWLLVESDLKPERELTSAVWNVVAPRSDVSGRISLIGRRGRTRQTYNFRGTGYHDQVSSSNVHYRDLNSRMWGRAHFTDTTVVFDRLGGVQNPRNPGRFYLIRNGEIKEYQANCEASEVRRTSWGMRVPGRVAFQSEDGIRLSVKPINAFRSGFSEVKTFSEITLGLRDGKPRNAIGITEFINPARLQNRVFRWLSGLRIGSEDRSPLF